VLVKGEFDPVFISSKKRALGCGSFGLRFSGLVRVLDQGCWFGLCLCLDLDY
jgi:hypothetical protein